VNLPALFNFLLHDTTERIRRSQNIESVVCYNYLIRLIVSYNLTQQQSSWEELIFAIEGRLALPVPNPVPKRKRTTLARNIPQKCRQSSRLRSRIGVA